MYQIQCEQCRRTEGVEISRTRLENQEPDRDAVISESLRTELQCVHCNITDTVRGGALPTLQSEYFSNVWVEEDSKQLPLQVNGEIVRYESVDEQIAENAYYTPDGVRGTSTVHHLHVHAIDPPTLSKGVHTVELGSYLSGEFVLSDIRYREGNCRTLKFYQTIGSDSPEPIDDEASFSSSLA